ncbi:MAG TPA: acyltransferase [Actinomycetota bacterium]
MPTIEGGLTGPVGATSRIAGVDGFRAVAVLAVLVYHNWLYTAPQPEDLGYLSRFVFPHLLVGVTMFFVLSGFLLYRPFVARAQTGRRPPSLRHYLRNRALRIFPAYWVILLATGVILPASIVRISTTEVELGRLEPTGLLRNAALVQNYFAGSMDTGILPAWSLAVEWIFYLVLPFLGMLAILVAARTVGGGRTMATLVPPLLLFLMGLVTPWIVDRLEPGTMKDALGRSFLTHGDLFAFGMVLAIVMASIEHGGLRMPRWWRVPAFGLIAALALIAMLLADRELIYIYQGAVIYELLTGPAAMLLLALVVVPSADGSLSLLTRILDSRAFVALGLISYSLFLWHEPLQRLAFKEGLTLPGVSGFWANLVILGVVATALSVLTYRFIERPALALKARPGSGEPADRPSSR